MNVLSETQGDSKSAKRDIKSLIAIIPPPQSLTAKQPKIKERRIRLRYSGLVKPDELRLSKSLAEELEIKDVVQIVVGGKKSVDLKAVIDDKLPPNEVLGNPEAMKSKGIADNSIVTIRGK
ncbi:MAG: hypothetical protein RMH77_06245 [Sulfolobales archaeon]|nr:hypothetical protein [Sulfolobales archaeon]MCX8185537.1 hypothetical protein [Sulfolobales archaeon]MDW7969984.1 hypothetical protein [Sulfolobales archaeon]